MSLGGSQPELPDPPRLVGDWGRHFNPFPLQLFIITGGGVNTQVAKVTVVTQLAGRYGIPALAQHNHAVVLLDEDPTKRLGRYLESEIVNEKIGRFPDVMDGQHVVVLKNLWHVASPFPSSC